MEQYYQNSIYFKLKRIVAVDRNQSTIFQISRIVLYCVLFPGLHKPVSWGCSKLKVNTQYNYRMVLLHIWPSSTNNYIICCGKQQKKWFPSQLLITKIHTPQEEVCKYHEKYEKRVSYFSCKYEYKISNKHLKQASQTVVEKGSQTKQPAIYATTILRSSITRQQEY